MDILHIDYTEITKPIRIARASSKNDILQLLDYSKKIAKKNDVLQLLNPDVIINQNHIHAAYLNAYVNFIDNANLSNAMSMEFLLYLSFTTQISAAIKLSGIKNNDDFIIVANSEPLIREFCSLSKTQANPYEAYNNENISAMRLFGIKDTENPDKEVLLKMSEIKFNI